MASPWIPPQRHPAERPWMGMVMLVAIPLLSLILIRMLWSGSSLWFLTVGLILLGTAGVIFLARRPQEHEYGRQTLAPEANRLPLALTGLGVLFLVMLLLPNFAGGDSDQKPTSQQQRQQQAPAAVSDVAGVDQAPAQQPSARQTPVQEQLGPSPEEAIPAGSQVYVVMSDDTLWDIAQRFGTTVEAIVAANDLESPEDLQIGQELIIPPPEEGAAPVGAAPEGALPDESVPTEQPYEEPAPLEPTE